MNRNITAFKSSASHARRFGSLTSSWRTSGATLTGPGVSTALSCRCFREWSAPILYLRSIDGKFDVAYYANVLISSNGWMYWLPPAIYRSTCSIEITYFPFDYQNCTLAFRCRALISPLNVTFFRMQDLVRIYSTKSSKSDPRRIVPMRWTSSWPSEKRTRLLSGWTLTQKLSQVHKRPFVIFWTQKSASAYSAFNTQRTASGPLSIVQPGRWSTRGIPQMTWSTKRSCSIWSSKGSPSSTSLTSSCPARSYPRWWCWPTSYLLKVWK